MSQNFRQASFVTECHHVTGNPFCFFFFAENDLGLKELIFMFPKEKKINALREKLQITMKINKEGTYSQKINKERNYRIYSSIIRSRVLCDP